VAIDLGIDEGGSGNDLLVSVQLGVNEQAKKLKKSWKQRLPERLPYFHSKDFSNHTGGVFTKAGLDGRARRELLVDLCKIIHARLITGLTVRINVSQYDSLTTQDFRSQHGTAYSFAVDLCMLFAYQQAIEAAIKPEFNILIENGHRNSNQAAQILSKIQGFPAHQWKYYEDEIIADLRILTAGLGDKKEHPILQSADMLAYCEWQRDSRGDPTIWSALNRRDIRYKAYEMRCDEEIIQAFVDEGSKKALWRRLKKAKALYEAEQKISAV
jgi:hypothetical protein